MSRTYKVRTALTLTDTDRQTDRNVQFEFLNQLPSTERKSANKRRQTDRQTNKFVFE